MNGSDEVRRKTRPPSGKVDAISGLITKQSDTGQCPDCCYSLAGLSSPRCPECGLEFDEHLLANPQLAVPRPAWERRPHVSRFRAIRRTLMGLTFRPQKFFASIRQPDRLRRSLTWHLSYFMVLVLLVLAYAIVEIWTLSGSGPVFRIDFIVNLFLNACIAATLTILPAALIVEMPMAAMLLIADLTCWRERSCFRIFFKGTNYSIAVYCWAVLAICGVNLILLAAGGFSTQSRSAYWPWATCFFALVITWQYLLLFLWTLNRNTGPIAASRSARHRLTLAVPVVFGWLCTMYLTLFDSYLGMRFCIGIWSGG